MNVPDHFIHRLFKAAAAVPRPEVGALPFALESRTLAAWRAADFSGEWDALRRFFRVGLGLASVLTLVIVAFSLRAIAQEPARELALPNVIVNLALSR